MSKFGLGVITLLLAFGLAYGQAPTGTATGRVTSTDGEGLPGATVSLSGQGSGITAITNERGQWTIRGLAPGDYTMAVTLEGFATQQRPIMIAASETVSVETLLKLAEIVEEITFTSEAPVIAGAQNSASNRLAHTSQPGVSPGGTANVFGVNFTDQPLVQPNELPLQNNLGGASFMVMMDGQTYPTYPVFLTPNQAGLILDSSTPPGRGRLQGEIDGVMTNSWAIDVVPLSPSIYTFGQDGVGQGIFTRFDFSLVTYADPLTPGEDFIGWGNGWGASQFDATGGQFDKRDQYDGLKIYFGDELVADEDMLYLGTAGGFAGGDQVIGRVPPNAPLGCGTPFFGVIDPAGPGSPVISNIVTVPISADGGPCGDQTGLSSAQISNLALDGDTSIVDITLDELTLFSSEAPDFFFVGTALARSVNTASYKPPIPNGTCVMKWRPDNFVNPRAPQPLTLDGEFAIELPWTQFSIGPASNVAPYTQAFRLPDTSVIIPGSFIFNTSPGFAVNGVAGQLMGAGDYPRIAGRLSDELTTALTPDAFVLIDDAVNAAIAARTAVPFDPDETPINFGYRANFDGGPRGTWTLNCRESLTDLQPDASIIELAHEMLCGFAPDSAENGTVDVFLFPADTDVPGDFPSVDAVNFHTDSSNRYPLGQPSEAITDTSAFATCP